MGVCEVVLWVMFPCLVTKRDATMPERLLNNPFPRPTMFDDEVKLSMYIHQSLLNLNPPTFPADSLFLTLPLRQTLFPVMAPFWQCEG